MKILGIIPARGGSKGVPRKNIKLLAGKPLLQYTTEPALASRFLSKIVLSTDDTEIAEVGRSLGIEVPFMRPAELAQDSTPTLPVLQHALRYFMDRGEPYDAICLLQPTNPLRDTAAIDGCIEMFIQQDMDTVFTMLPVPHEYNPYWVFLPDENGHLHLSTGGYEPIPRRQILPPAYHREGSVYVCRASNILERNSMYGTRIGGYLLEQATPINIDTLADWEKAEAYFEQAGYKQNV